MRRADLRDPEAPPGRKAFMGAGEPKSGDDPGKSHRAGETISRAVSRAKKP